MPNYPGRSYAITSKGLTIIANATLVFINPKATGSGSGIEIIRCWISQNANATSAQVSVQLHSQVSTFPTLITTNATPVALDQASNIASGIIAGTAGAAGTCGVNASAEGAGAQTPFYVDNFNALNGWLYIPTPEERPRFGVAATAAGFGMKIVGTPGTLTGWSWGVVYNEV